MMTSAAMSIEEWLSSDDPVSMLQTAIDDDRNRQLYRKIDTMVTVGDRRLRLVACALYRTMLNTGNFERMQDFLMRMTNHAEDYADGLVHVADMNEYAGGYDTWLRKIQEGQNVYLITREMLSHDIRYLENVIFSWLSVTTKMRIAQAGIIRGIFPYHRVHLEYNAAGGRHVLMDSGHRMPLTDGFIEQIAGDGDVLIRLDWLTPTVQSLAAAAQESVASGPSLTQHLDPERLAILSDALEDAGCDCQLLLRHLRMEEPRPGGEWQSLRSNYYRGFWSLDALLSKEYWERRRNS